MNFYEKIKPEVIQYRDIIYKLNITLQEMVTKYR